MKKKLLALALALMPMQVFSQHRSESDAIAVAQEFWGNTVNRAKLKAVSQSSIVKAKARAMAKASSTTSGSKQSFYVINDEEHDRFVIVSADERLQKILGYSDNGTFDAESAPDGLLDMMNEYDGQYAAVFATLGKTSRASECAKTRAIQPLIKTKWGQKAPYNQQCPIDKRESDGSICAAGCVATAMAQIMNYYQYPSHGIGSVSYRTNTQKIPQSMDFSATTFNWNLMQSVYDENSTAEQKEEVAKLMHACGVAVAMDYGQWKGGTSGAAPTDIPYALINYFGYNPNIVYRHRDYYSSEEWNDYIMKELEGGHPLLYGGFNSEYKNGHRFILDGCDENGLYHFNFGWTISSQPDYAGYANGYYSLDVLHAEDLRLSELAAEKGKELDLGDFSYNQSMICNVTPEKAGIHEDIFYCIGFDNFNSTTVGNQGYCTLKAECYSSESSNSDPHNPQFYGSLGIGLFDVNFNFIKPLMSTMMACKTYKEAIVVGNVTLDATTFTDGSQYIIAPFVKSEKSDNPSRIRAKYGKKQYYLAKCTNGKVDFIENGIAEAEHVVTGPFTAISNDGKTMWQIILRQDDGQEGVYWISNLDPAVSGANEVRCVVNETGKTLSVDVNQELREGIRLYTQTGGNTLTLCLNATDSTIVIKDVWGSVETSATEQNTSQKELSRYSGTNFVYGILDSNGNVNEALVTQPVISCTPDDRTVKIYCSTDGAEIYYTLDGSVPGKDAIQYTGIITLDKNYTISAIAIKGDKVSEITSKKIDWFVTQKPEITLSEDSKMVYMTCLDADAKIYYTTDGTVPTERSTIYNGPLENSETTTYKAIAYKDGYNCSSIAIRFVEAFEPDVKTVFIVDNIAGKLQERLSEIQIANTVSLSISGELNGTDVKLIREMLQKGHLSSLNIEHAAFVDGGDKYYASHVTKRNVITAYMFDKCTNLVEIKLPNTIIGIEEFGFDGCKNINEITLPDSCKDIHPLAFPRCTNLEKINVRENNPYLKSIDGVLYSKDGNSLLRFPIGKLVSHYEIPEGVTEIHERAFEKTSITTFSCPSTLKTIGKYAFSNCANIVHIDIPESVVVLDEGAFDSCKGLFEVNMSSNVMEFRAFAFSYCSNLRTFEFGKNVTKISEYAFTGCNSLQSINVDLANQTFCSYNGAIYSKDKQTLVLCPNGLYSEEYHVAEDVTSIANRAFAGCKNIETIALPESVTSIGSYAFNKCTMKSIHIPDNVGIIKNDAFYDCDSLESFAFPNKITRLENNVLGYCNNLSYVYIPANVEYIGLSAFQRCNSLKMIECEIYNINNVEVYESSILGITAFDGIPADCTWRIPSGCAEDYKAQPWWVSTWRIIEDPDAITDISNDNDTKVIPRVHSVDIVASSSKIINIYNIQGHLVNSVKVKSGQETTVPLQPGIYIIDGYKIRVR